MSHILIRRGFRAVFLFDPGCCFFRLLFADKAHGNAVDRVLRKFLKISDGYLKRVLFLREGVYIPARMYYHRGFPVKFLQDRSGRLRGKAAAVQHLSLSVYNERAAHGDDEIRVQETPCDV